MRSVTGLANSAKNIKKERSNPNKSKPSKKLAWSGNLWTEMSGRNATMMLTLTTTSTAI